MRVNTLSRKDAAAMLGISVSSLDRLCKHGKIAFVSVTDRRRVFRLEDIEAYLAQEVVPPKN
ncbi:MAG: helix-turn-helix domain-containing protein [Armatimonadetes bacterium]|nr:helix-turn-helix domain-containing protein [Armatimonadota bacterium]